MFGVHVGGMAEGLKQTNKKKEAKDTRVGSVKGGREENNKENTSFQTGGRW